MPASFLKLGQVKRLQALSPGPKPMEGPGGGGAPPGDHLPENFALSSESL